MRKVETVRAQPGTRDRLVTTLFLAALAHGVVILGISFSDPPGDGARANTLEVTVVSSPDGETPEDADYLAQADQSGAGNVAERVRPESAQSTLSEMPNPGMESGWAEESELDVADVSDDPDSLDAPDAIETPDPVLTAEDSDAPVMARPEAPRTTRQPLQLARLMTDGAEQAEPISDEDRQPRAHSDDPREQFISVNTRESRFARYLEEWRVQVEAVGNENYPEEARREGMTGSLSLEVAVNADGTLAEITPRSSSGHPELDRAAARIVREAAPFPPFPDKIREDTDTLRFVYRWEFGAERTLRGGVHVEE